MLKIQVLGTGMIPRGMGLAPRKAPFKADYTLIATIMNTPGLKVNFLNPETNKFQSLTPQNIKRMWDKYANWEARQAAIAKAAAEKAAAESEANDGTAPHVPDDDKHDEIKKETPSTPSVTPPATTEEKKPETPAEEPKGDVNPTDVAAAAAAAMNGEKSEERTEEKPAEEKKEEQKDPAVTPGTIRTVLNIQQNNQKKNHK